MSLLKDEGITHLSGNPFGQPRTNLPLTVVLLNNGGYRIIKQRLQAFHGTNHFVGMDFRDPSVDFTGIARSLGIRATQVNEGDQFGTFYRRRSHPNS